MRNQSNIEHKVRGEAFTAGLASCVGAGGLTILCSLWSGDLRYIEAAPEYITTASWVLGVTMSIFPVIALYSALLGKSPAVDEQENRSGGA